MQEEKESVAFEIDLSEVKRLQRVLGLNRMDCYPILWCFDQNFIKWTINFE
jgi:hypothetical protein